MKLALAMPLIWLGCSEFDAGKFAPDPGLAPGDEIEDDTGDVVDDVSDALDCDTAPSIDWINFGEAFMVQNCNGCHHSSTVDRYGAPEHAIFDTAEEVWTRKGMVLATAGGETPSMPPSGGTTEEDRRKLSIWLMCGEFGD